MNPQDEAPRTRDWSAGARVAGTAILLLGFIPWYNWLPTGHDRVGYRWLLLQWGYAAAAMLLAGLLALATWFFPALWRAGLWTRLTDRLLRNPQAFALAVALLALAMNVAASTFLFGRHPADVDDAVQLLQARAFARGEIWQRLGPFPEFLASTHDLLRGERAAAQFPPGNPALLALGVLVGAPWLVVPLLGALGAWLFARLLSVVEPRRTVAAAAALILPLSPFVLGLAGSHMNHVPALTAILLAMYGLARATSAPAARGSWRWAMVAGLGLGAAATLRPLDALAFALPAAAWLLVRALRDPSRWGDAFAAAAGVAIALAPMLWYNAEVTGHPLRLGYSAVWGRAHSIGFHEAPYGPRHTPVRGFALLSFYFVLLQHSLFTTPVPALVPVVAALWLARRLRAFDRYLLASGALLAVGYWAYWYRGLLLGPRFMLPLVPLLVLWAARLPALVRERAPNGSWHRITVFAVLVSVITAATYHGPARYAQLRIQFEPSRADVPGMMRQLGAAGGIVLVREHWGNSLVARLWALGVPHPLAARTFDNADLCRLDHLVSRLEVTQADSVEAVGAVRRLLADSIFTRSRVLPGTNVYLTIQDDSAFTPACRARVKELERGSLALPLVRVHEGRTLIARDLHARDTLLLARYPGRPVFVLEPVAGRERMKLVPLNLDSARRDWALAP